MGNDLVENNRTGFSALPAGRIAGWSYYTGILTMFWSSTIVSNEDVLSHDGCDTAFTWSWYREMGYVCDSIMARGIGQDGCFFSVRCLQDSENYNSSANTHPYPVSPTDLDYDNNVHNNERVRSQIRIKENQCTTHDFAGENITSGNRISVTKAY